MAAREPKFVTADFLATERGVTSRQIRNYEHKGMPKAGPNKYPLDDCREWIDKFMESKGTNPTLRDAEVRLKTAQAEVQELKLASARGELLPAKLVGALWEKAIGAFKVRMLSIPRKSIMKLRGVKTDTAREKVLTGMICEALDDLAVADYSGVINGVIEDVFRGDTPGEEPPAADDQPVGGSIPGAKPRKQRTARKMEYKHR